MKVLDIGKLVAGQVRAECDEAGQMTLGQFIDAIRQLDQEAQICFDFARLRPTGIDSYRGYYDHLAIGFSDDGWSKVADVLKFSQDAMGKVFTGYKGGDYVMGEDTPLWVANWGNSGGSRIIGVQDGKYEAVILTAPERS